MAADDDWVDDAPTAVDGDPLPEEVFAERATDELKSTDWLAGREQGFSEGVAACVRALEPMLRGAGCTPEEVQNITLKMRLGAEDRG